MAKIVVNDIGLGYKSIAAALLHDVVEDTDYTVDDIRNLFGDKIASLVDGLTKIKNVLDNQDKKNKDNGYTESLQAELKGRVAGIASSAESAGGVEVILALSGDVEGETTAFYIYRQIAPYGVKVSSLARGLGFGDDLEYADQLTLGRSIVDRQLFKP